MNKITIIGNVVHTPQMRSTQSGMSVCSFSVAVKRRFKNAQTGEYETDFFDVQAWRQLAELCEKYLEKGKKVAVIGAMQSRDYEKDGVKKRIWELVADEVEFLTPKNEQTTGANPNFPTRENVREMVKRAAAEAQMAAQSFTQVDDDEPLPF
jgi:single-strand DNA-binding protein